MILNQAQTTLSYFEKIVSIIFNKREETYPKIVSPFCRTSRSIDGWDPQTEARVADVPISTPEDMKN